MTIKDIYISAIELIEDCVKKGYDIDYLVRVYDVKDRYVTKSCKKIFLGERDISKEDLERLRSLIKKIDDIFSFTFNSKIKLRTVFKKKAQLSVAIYWCYIKRIETQMILMNPNATVLQYGLQELEQHVKTLTNVHSPLDKKYVFQYQQIINLISSKQ